MSTYNLPGNVSFMVDPRPFFTTVYVHIKQYYYLYDGHTTVGGIGLKTNLLHSPNFCVRNKIFMKKFMRLTTVDMQINLILLSVIPCFY